MGFGPIEHPQYLDSESGFAWSFGRVGFGPIEHPQYLVDLSVARVVQGSHACCLDAAVESAAYGEGVVP